MAGEQLWDEVLCKWLGDGNAFTSDADINGTQKIINH